VRDAPRPDPSRQPPRATQGMRGAEQPGATRSALLRARAWRGLRAPTIPEVSTVVSRFVLIGAICFHGPGCRATSRMTGPWSRPVWDGP
jgi:hypothetical protein